MDTCSWKFICRAHFLSPGISSDLYLSTIIWLVYCQHGILPQIINPTCTCWVISSQKAKRKTSLSLKNKNKLHVVYTCNWNFSTMNARALIFYTSVPYDKTFLRTRLTVWHWPCSLAYFLIPDVKDREVYWFCPVLKSGINTSTAKCTATAVSAACPRRWPL